VNLVELFLDFSVKTFLKLPKTSELSVPEKRVLENLESLYISREPFFIASFPTL
jgi:hypothetical protein